MPKKPGRGPGLRVTVRLSPMTACLSETRAGIGSTASSMRPRRSPINELERLVSTPNQRVRVASRPAGPVAPPSGLSGRRPPTYTGGHHTSGGASATEPGLPGCVGRLMDDPRLHREVRDAVRWQRLAGAHAGGGPGTGAPDLRPSSPPLGQAARAHPVSALPAARAACRREPGPQRPLHRVHRDAGDVPPIRAGRDASGRAGRVRPGAGCDGRQRHLRPHAGAAPRSSGTPT